MWLKRLRSFGIEISPNPEAVTKMVNLEEMKFLLAVINEVEDGIEFEEWRRVDVDGKRK